MAKVSFSTSGIKSWWELCCGTSSTGCPLLGRSVQGEGDGQGSFLERGFSCGKNQSVNSK